MWKARLLLLLLGNAWLWLSAAAAAVTPQPEDEIVSPGVGRGAVISGAEDYMVTAGASEHHLESKVFQDLVPTSADRVISRIEDHSNPEGTVHSHKEIPKPTTPNVATSHPVEQVDGETEKTTEKDGLTTVTLAGIVVGVLLGIGVIGGIAIAVARKMSGRY